MASSCMPNVLLMRSVASRDCAQVMKNWEDEKRGFVLLLKKRSARVKKGVVLCTGTASFPGSLLAELLPLRYPPFLILSTFNERSIRKPFGCGASNSGRRLPMNCTAHELRNELLKMCLLTKEENENSFRKEDQ